MSTVTCRKRSRKQDAIHGVLLDRVFLEDRGGAMLLCISRTVVRTKFCGAADLTRVYDARSQFAAE